jgi:ABC-type sugar transport system permease subunit/ABC-type glycerol-3-phosphate transport system substrate-binding protein
VLYKVLSLALLFICLVFPGGERHFLFADDQSLEVWAMGSEGKKIGEVAKEFEKRNPGVQVLVQAIPWGAAHEKLITAVAGDTTPDVCQLGSTWVSEFETMKVLLPLDSYLEKSTLKADQFFEGSWNINVVNSRLYGIPWYVDTRVLFYRKDLLAAAGFPEPPKTWDELLEVSRRLAVDSDQDGKKDRYAISLPIRDWGHLAMFIWQNGGQILSSDFKSASLNSPEVIEAFKFYINFFKESLTPRELASGTDVFNAFDKGFLPMFISGPWMLRELHEQLPHLDDKWSVAVLPKKKNFTSFVGGSSLVVFKASQNPNLAWKFVEFMNQTETQVEWYKLTEDLPSRKDAWQDPYFQNLDRVKTFGQQLTDTQSSPSLPQWEQIADIINNEMERAIFGKQTAEEAVQKISEQTDIILNHQEPVQSPIFKATVVGVFCGVILFLLIVYFASSKFSQRAQITNISIWGKARRHLKAYAFVTPSLIILFLFLFAPIFMSLLMSFTNWDIRSLVDLNQVSFVGIDNYKNLVGDPIFRRALWNTIIFVVVGGPLTMIVALSLASLLNSAVVRFRSFFRVGFFTPVVTTMVAVAVVWRWLYNARFGLINYFLELLGIEGKNWLGDATWAMPALILMAVWKNFGYHMVIFLAGLQGIPPHLYEAAHIDGANRFQCFLHVTIPLLKPTIFFVAIMTSIGYFQFFAEPYIMTDGGPLDSTISVILHMYRQGFKYFHMGYASAIAYVLFIVIAIFSVFQFKMNKQSFEY